jgi:hypothetical protein
MRLDSDRDLLDGHEFGERTDTQVIGPGVDLVADFELAYAWPHLNHHAGHVMTQYERRAIRQDELELSVSDLGIHQVDRCRVNFDQHLVFAQHRYRHTGCSQALFFAVAINNKCFHGFSFSQEVQGMYSAAWPVSSTDMMIIIFAGKKNQPMDHAAEGARLFNAALHSESDNAGSSTARASINVPTMVATVTSARSWQPGCPQSGD